VLCDTPPGVARDTLKSNITSEKTSWRHTKPDILQKKDYLRRETPHLPNTPRAPTGPERIYWTKAPPGPSGKWLPRRRGLGGTSPVTVSFFIVLFALIFGFLFPSIFYICIGFWMRFGVYFGSLWLHFSIPFSVQVFECSFHKYR
jgi:hypothetical protein